MSHDGKNAFIRPCFAACALCVGIFVLHRFWTSQPCDHRNIDIRLRPIQRGGPAAAHQKQADGHSALFILYSWNYELLRTALQAYVAAGWGPHTIIIDNSSDRRLVDDHLVNELVREIIPTRPSGLSFSQLQNVIADIAMERNYTYYLWGHSDIAVMASNATALHSAEVLGCMERIMSQEPSWGLAFFAHEGVNCKDHLQATRTAMARDLQYDTFITVYFSDCDYYSRVLRDGWKLASYTDHCPGVDLKTFDLKQPLELPVDDYSSMEKLLKREEAKQDINRNAWKIEAWSRGEDAGWNNWEKSSLAYFKQKWNLSDDYNGFFCPDLEHHSQPWTTPDPHRPPRKEAPAPPWCTRSSMGTVQTMQDLIADIRA
ncbi:g6686 [Coccomyxa viridis]|uniref:G6686 protein n=1 Tax=Coccomyxa viridis TaxID=1274662 RepID=A0ABP1FYF4_9CHLO